MGAGVRKKGCSLILPFFIGLILGLLISYGIRKRVLSRSSSCSQKSLTPLSPVDAHVPTPDQIVNLATNQENLLFGDNKSDNKSGIIPRDVNRPRKLLFVGVMTASIFLQTRARAVWETWGKDIPGKVVFFTGGNTFNGERQKSFNESFSLVPLPGVDDSYPPQKKAFHVLRYMYENYGDDYEYFMRADDDVYVRANHLADFLRQVDSRQLAFIGQAGKGNRIEKGTLNLAHNENFCMGGPGIILSRPTLRKVAPNVLNCLKDMYSTHEDVEVGRCVQRYAGVSCTWAYEMQTVFHHNSSGDLAFTGKLKRREVHKAITLHPVKDFKHLYRLHVHFESLKIQDLMYNQILIHRDILQLSSKNSSIYDKKRQRDISSVFNKDLYPLKDYTSTGLLPSLNKFSPTELNDIIDWEFIGSQGIFSAGGISPKLKLKSDGKEALEDVVREVMDSLNSYSRARGRIVDFKEILYGYRRVNPLHGADYILDLLMTYRKYRGRKMTIPVRRHIYTQRPFSPLQIRLTLDSLNSSKQFINENSKTKMVMIVPLAGRYETFQRFLDTFSTTCMELYKTDSTIHSQYVPFELNLVVVLFGTDKEKEKFLYLVKQKRATLLSLGGGKSLCKIKMVQIDSGRGVGLEFSRSLALETGISQCNDEDIVFAIDVDLSFTADAIKSVNLNTRKGEQAYFPIVYSQYNPKYYYSLDNNDKGDAPRCHNFSINSQNLECPINSDLGYWRDFGYGICSFYKSDFRKTGGFDTSIKGWGQEDVKLFERFITNTNLTIFRSPDPHLVHVFHEKECDKRLSKLQLAMCLGSKQNTLGSEKNLMKYLLEQNHH